MLVEAESPLESIPSLEPAINSKRKNISVRKGKLALSIGALAPGYMDTNATFCRWAAEQAASMREKRLDQRGIDWANRADGLDTLARSDSVNWAASWGFCAPFLKGLYLVIRARVGD